MSHTDHGPTGEIAQGRESRSIDCKRKQRCKKKCSTKATHSVLPLYAVTESICAGQTGNIIRTCRSTGCCCYVKPNPPPEIARFTAGFAKASLTLSEWFNGARTLTTLLPGLADQHRELETNLQEYISDQSIPRTWAERRRLLGDIQATATQEEILIANEKGRLEAALISAFPWKELVAGVGFEPTTFGL